MILRTFKLRRVEQLESRNKVFETFTDDGKRRFFVSYVDLADEVWTRVKEYGRAGLVHFEGEYPPEEAAQRLSVLERLAVEL